MTSGNDIGAYMLGASIAKSDAQRDAEFRAWQVQREHDEELAKETRRADKNYDVFAYETIRSSARRTSRCRSADAAEALAKRADRERLTSADILAAFAHDLDGATSLKNMIEDGREAARIWMAEESEVNAKCIRKALARFVADHEKLLEKYLPEKART